MTFIPKAGKPNYTDAKATILLVYTLSSFGGKEKEKGGGGEVDRHIRDDIL
jgi:hypothetical protein